MFKKAVSKEIVDLLAQILGIKKFQQIMLVNYLSSVTNFNMAYQLCSKHTNEYIQYSAWHLFKLFLKYCKKNKRLK
eukprot:UN33268